MLTANIIQVYKGNLIKKIEVGYFVKPLAIRSMLAYQENFLQNFFDFPLKIFFYEIFKRTQYKKMSIFCLFLYSDDNVNFQNNYYKKLFLKKVGKFSKIKNF